MGGVIHTRICIKCGRNQSRGVYYPELAVFAIGFIVFVFAYPKVDWRSLAAGSPGAADLALAALMAVFCVIAPLRELIKTLLINLEWRKPFPDKCPECGGREFSHDRGFS